ncbi:MAG: single-stranded DNA-binding protein [Candidatus Omnitrophota bacterium]|jgi:single-strand DNA-binding protein
MASLNRVLLIGNLTKDPELRYTPQGTAVVNLRLAVNRKYRDKSQEMKEDTCFLTVVVWDKQAETCNQYLRKGSPVFIEGRLQSRSWEDNAGQKRSVVEVRAERVQFLSAGTNAGTNKEHATAVEDAPPDAVTETAWPDENEERSHNG